MKCGFTNKSGYVNVALQIQVHIQKKCFMKCGFMDEENI